MHSDQSHQPFRTTTWGEIRALAAGDPDRQQQAITQLTERYWPPVYAHLRGRGISPDTAAEATQAFFTEVVLERRLFEKADARRGRLRNLILTALNNHLRDRHRRAMARGAGITIAVEDIQREEARLGPLDGASPDHLFERRWALGIFETALTRGQAHYRRIGKGRHWTLFEARVLHPAQFNHTPPGMAELAAAHGFDSPLHASATVQTVKRRVQALLREVIAETIDDESSIEDELTLVQAYLGGGA